MEESTDVRQALLQQTVTTIDVKLDKLTAALERHIESEQKRDVEHARMDARVKAVEDDLKTLKSRSLAGDLVAIVSAVAAGVVAVFKQ